MSETEIGREPVELVELVLPRCANVYGSAPCQATGSEGVECFNTRATCQDPDNYRDTPDKHLTPDLLLASGEEIVSGEINRTASLFAAFDVRFSSDPEGIIWEQGSGTRGVYLGVDSGDLVFEVLSNNTGTIAVDAVQFLGKTLTLYVEIDFTASGSTTIRLWSFDPVELRLTLLGTDTFTADVEWSGGDPGGIGNTFGSGVGANRPNVSWNGVITEARFFEAQTAPSMEDNFRASLWLGRGIKGEPTNEKYILPCLTDVGTLGTRINLYNSDDDYEPLGRRATLNFTVSDFTHSDITQDPYYATRLYDPRERSTFWRKWLARQKFGKVGALVKVHSGYTGQPLSAYSSRAYVMDKVTRSEDGLDFHCRDVLTRTEFRKAQVPVPVSGKLNDELTEDAEQFIVTGDVTAEYPESGTVRINDEILTYTSRTAAGSPVLTTFTGLSRGTDGSDVSQHDVNDVVQVCRRWVNQSIDSIVKELLLDDAGIEGQLVNIAEIEDEVGLYLDAYRLTSLITEPTGVDQLIGRLSAECSFYIWWDERQQQIRLKAIRGVTPDDTFFSFTDSEHIVRNSLQITEKPKQRLNVITFYYNPLNFAGDLDKPSNFKNGLKVINGTTSLPEQYGNLVQTRDVFSIFIKTEAEANQTSSRLSLRYADIPTFATFYVDAKDREIWVGDIGTLEHPEIVDATGQPEVRNWIVVEAEEVVPGHLIAYTCTDVTLDGRIFFITENGIGTYDAAEFANGNAFITDNNGLNPDGTEGARIS